MISTLSLLAAAVVSAAAPATNDEIRIARFQNDKAAAVSYTFDDGLRDQFEIAAPMLDARGIRGTFFIITKPTAKTPAEGRAIKPGGFGGISWPELKELAGRGHEIANHTWTHRDLRKIPWAEVRPEFDLADRDILENLGQPALTVAYTANSFDDSIRKEALRQHLADRTFQKGFGGPKFTEAEANTWLDETLRDGKWGVAMIHGIVAGFYPFTDPQILTRHLDHARDLKSEVWIDTFAAVANYIRTRDASQLTATSMKQGKASFTLESDLPAKSEDGKVDFPAAALTVVVNAPGVHEASATRDGQPLPTRVAEGHILVNVQPGSQPVTVRWK